MALTMRGELKPGPRAHSESIFGDGEDQHFHEGGTFLGVWILVVLVGVHTLAAMEEILVPLLWALFLMAGLLPLTDRVEAFLAWTGQYCCCCCPRRSKDPKPVVTPTDGGGPGQRGSHRSLGSAGATIEEHEPFVHPSDSDEEALEEDEHCNWARTLAVCIVVSLFVVFITLFSTLIYRSALHMEENWNVYEAGASKNLHEAHRIYSKVFRAFPPDVLESFSKKVVTSLQDGISDVLSEVVSNVTGIAVKIGMMLLYMIFWLCSPVPMGSAFATAFKRYIFLKGQASVGYAFSCWLLLHFLEVDLAIVFGLVTFMFNWVPEVGPFIAMVLPLPLILMDGRMESPFVAAAVALLGQLAIKFVFGNIVELKLIERDQMMRLHPVVTLFFVAFFGWIWGTTGMLLSVPMAAAVKGSTPALPPRYRDSILIILEGDLNAPARHKRLRQALYTE